MRNTKKVILSIVLVLLLGFCVFCGVGLYVPAKEEAWPSWSPDGQRLAYECYVDGPTSDIAEWNGTYYTEEAADICIIDTDSNYYVRLVKDPGGDHFPVWSPDGLQIAYIRRNGVFVIDADGNNQRQLLHLPPGRELLVYLDEVTWSPDGKYLLFAGCLNEGAEQHAIYLIDVLTGDLINLTEGNRQQNFEPLWTLNGTRIVFPSTSVPLREGTCYLDDPPGEDRIYQLRVINVDGSGERVVHDSKNTSRPFISVSNAGQIAFAYRLGSSNLHIIDLDGTVLTEIEGAVSSSIIWAPNGQWLSHSIGNSYGSPIIDVETKETIYTLPPPIDNPPMNGVSVEIPVWSPDSQQIAVTTSINPTSFYNEKHIYIYDLQDGTVRPLIQSWVSFFAGLFL